MKKYSQYFALCLAALAADFRPLGSITAKNSIGWDQTDTNVLGFHIYLSETNSTNFTKVATVTTNRWAGDATKLLSGEKNLYLTAFNSKGEESDPSEIVRVLFRAGAPVPPTNINILQVVTAMATNALPPIPQ